MIAAVLTGWLAVVEPAAGAEPVGAEPTETTGGASTSHAREEADDGDEGPPRRTAESTGFVRLSPGMLQAPWGFRTNYQWGFSAGAWFQERRFTGSIGGFLGHVLGWKDSHILRVGLQTHLGRLFAFDFIEPSVIARIGYTAFLHGNRSHGATLGIALGLDISPDRRRRLVLGTAIGADFDFFTDVYLFPILTWRVSIGWRFRPKIVATSE